MSTARRHSSPNRQRQNGVAAMLILFVIAVVAISFLVSSLKSSSSQTERDKITAAALAQAKAGLIGYAAGVDLRSGAARPGDLPCPDMDDNGETDFPSCGNAPGTTFQERRLGRLPWKTLGLPDLRDGYGERLWYSVSNSFKKNVRALPLNSDTFGTITVRDSSGTIVNNGTQENAAIAVVIAPGASITRQDGLVQTRDAAGNLNPKNYLDILVGTEDNAGFIDSTTDGFIKDRIWDGSRNTVVNDEFVTITYSELMPLLEKRVREEVLACLTYYAANNDGRYPWAAKMDTSATPLPPAYSDDSNVLFGRLPDTPFVNTQTDGGVLSTMDDIWTPECNIKSASGWWLNWKEMVFYAVAGGCKPSPATGCSGTLVVNPPSSTPDKRIVVIVAGRRLAGVSGGQLRGNNAEKGTAANYLESNNLSGAPFQQSKATPSFNDNLGYR